MRTLLVSLAVLVTVTYIVLLYSASENYKQSKQMQSFIDSMRQKHIEDSLYINKLLKNLTHENSTRKTKIN